MTGFVDFGLLAATGLGVGIVVGLTGVGGGSIMTPLLITVFGVPAPVAVGTDLACAAVTKTAGTFAHRAANNIQYRVVALLAVGSVPAAIATLAIIALAQLAPHDLNRLIRESVGDRAPPEHCGAAAAQPAQALGRAFGAIARDAPRHRPALTVLVGSVIGIAVALTSLGAGAIGAAVSRAALSGARTG